MNKYVLIFAALAVILAAFLAHMTISLRREREELKTALNASLERVEQLRSDLQKQAAVLTDREIQINSLTSSKAYLSRQLKEAMAHDEEAKNWSDTLVPDAVAKLLKEGGAGISGDPGTASAAMPSTAMGRQD